MIDRVYFHFSKLEEYNDGMWRQLHGPARKVAIKSAAALMRDFIRFKAAMMEALERWPNSCEHNLSAENINRIAWLGHAGCCLFANSPEESTRAGWHTLTQSEQDEANRVAAEVLAQWDASRNTPTLLDLMGNGNA